ncbi:hypothetical protein [Sulfitobacter sp. S190]|uniref:hypothetical protein n=1 Tax=Sulfitobacter sp. S190 TaxID=2867022 RepID=UPI0021A7CEAF|nr:hypothetical protein [Sulfitobacter sp. S190]UWR24276.1 hypothetical protein K3756_13375 [Sulfitobacter sp. S190]
MKSDWILDVLADLRTFANANGLPALAEQLDDTALIATAEIASLGERPMERTHGDTAQVGSGLRDLGTGGFA